MQGTFEEDYRWLLEQNEQRRLAMLEFLRDYEPSKVTDGFAILKGTFNCVVNYARIEEYKGDKPELKGNKYFRYELEIAQGQENAGRKLWKSVDLANEDKCKKLADAMFTIGLSFKDEATLLECAEAFVKMTVVAKAWGFKPKEPKEGDGDEPIQMHIIKGLASEAGAKAKSEVPF